VGSARLGDPRAPALLTAILAAAIALRPPIVTIGALTPRIVADLGVSFAAMGALSTVTIVLVGLAAPLGPIVLRRFGFRWAVALCLILLLVVGVARGYVPGYPAVLVLSGLVGVFIGVSQVIVPAVGQDRRVSPRLASGAFTVGLVGSSIVAAAIAVPIATLVGGWQAALVALSIPGVASVGVWLAIVRSAAAPPVGSRPETTSPLRDPEARWLAIAFGVQAVLYHSFVAWLPEMSITLGSSEVQGGFLLALFNASALVASLLVLATGKRPASSSLLVVAFAVIACGSLVALSLGFHLDASVAVLGFALGAILPLLVALALTRAQGPSHASAMLALMFAAGYVIAGLAPLLLGAVRDMTGGFHLPVLLLLADAALLVAVAVRVFLPARA
jgi:CP family cyanate transporter-like MFS transporter